MVKRRSDHGATLSAAEFKAKCLRVMDQVAKTRQSITLTKRGKPIARIVPVEEEAADIFGCLAQGFELVGDVEAPILPAQRWTGLR